MEKLNLISLRATIINHRAKHHAIILELSSMINNVYLSILFDSSATGSFISPLSLIKCGLASQKHDDLIYLEMAYRVRQSILPIVENCVVELGAHVTYMNIIAHP